jgi:uncharacterized protein involved in type VI secretion and phage assembly
VIEELLQQLIERLDNRYYGKYRGYVSNVSDPESTGRIKAYVPRLLGEAETGWALPCTPYAGPDQGLYTIPDVGAGVWIEFEGGDVSRPIWTGCYWAKGDLPADAASADIKLIVTDAASFKIDDSAGEVELSNSSDSKTTWSADVVTEAGQAKHSIGSSGVTSESAASVGKVEVSDSGVSVNSGAFSVM